VFSKIRNKAVALLVKPLAIWFIKQQTQAIKDVKHLELDSKQKKFAMELELPGEAETLSVSGSYRLILENGKTTVAPTEIKTSKEWLTILAGELMTGRSFEVSGLVRNFL
jgi:hypothetical protein